MLPGLGAALSVNLKNMDLKNQYKRYQVSDPQGVLHVSKARLLPPIEMFKQLVKQNFTTTTAETSQSAAANIS